MIRNRSARLLRRASPGFLRRFLWLLLLVALIHSISAAETKTRNVFLLTADGLRWQEVFRGAEDLSFAKEFGNHGNSNAIRKEFLRETSEARREVLMPFLWGAVAKRG